MGPGAWRALVTDQLTFEGAPTMLKWVSWYNTHRLMAPLGSLPPVEFEAHDQINSDLAELALK